MEDGESTRGDGWPAWLNYGQMKWWLVALLAACSTSGVRSAEPVFPTLLVVNHSMSPVWVYGDDGHLVGRAGPGQQACMVLRHETKIRYLIYRKGGEVVVGPDLIPFDQIGWSVVINITLKLDVMSLQPAEPCT